MYRGSFNILPKPVSVIRALKRTVFAVLLAVFGIYSLTPSAQAASYTFTQTSWSGGNTANTAIHPTNQTSWNQYSSQSNLVVGANLTLSSSVAALSGRTDVTKNSTGDSTAPRFAIDSSGVIHVVYMSKEYNATYYNIVYRNSTNWANRVDLTTNTSVHSYNPRIAVDSTGVVHVAYYSNEYNASATNIVYRNSTNWANRVDVTHSNAINSSDPSIAVDASNVAHIAYQSMEFVAGYNNIVYRNSTNWNNRVDVTANAARNANLPVIAVDSTGVVHIAYQSVEVNATYYNIAYRNSTNWSNRVDVTSGSREATDASIAVDSSNNAHIAYLSKEYNATYINVAYRNSTDWATRVDLTTSASVSSLNPSVAVDSAGNAHVAYVSKEYNASYFNVAYRNSTNWANRVDVTNNTSVAMAGSFVVVDSAGKIHIMYQSKEFFTTYNIAYRNSDNWANRVDVTNGNNKDAANSVAVTDSSGVTHVAYLSYEYNANVLNVAYRNSTNWANRVDVTATSSAVAVPSQTPAIAVDSAGKVYIAYYSKEFNAAYNNIALRSSDNWASRTDVTASAIRDSMNPSIAVDSTGKVHVAYISYEYNVNYLNFAYRNSDNWANRADVTRVATNVINSQTPSIVVDSTGKAYVVYYSYELDASYFNIVLRDSSNWVTRRDITNNNFAGSYQPKITIDSSDVIHLAYASMEYNSSKQNIAYRNSTNWANRTNVTTNTTVSSYAPVIAVDSSGVVHIAYHSNEFNATYYNIAYRNSTNWNNRVDVTTSTTVTTVAPSIALSASGYPQIFYGSKELVSTQYNIAAKTYNPGGYQALGSLVSSAYDSGDNTNGIGGVSWTEDGSLPLGTGVSLSLRTAASSAGLSSASWSDITRTTPGCSKAGTTVTCSASAIPLALKTGSANQWFQYKANLTSTGANTPTVSGVTVTYNMNAAPQFDATYGTNGVSTLQVSTSTDPSFGKVLINYSIRDIDTNTGSSTPGYITPSFEYNTGSGWNLITSGFLSAGDLVNKAVSTSTYSTYQAIWNAQSQIPSVYSTTTQIRVTANDNELTKNIATSTSPAFPLDTKVPSAALTLNVASSTVSFSASDNSLYQYLLSNNSNGAPDGLNASSGIYSLATTSPASATSTWNFVSSYPTAYLLIKDAFNNSITVTAVAPYKPINVDVKDVSSSGTYKEFVSWPVYTPIAGAVFSKYELYRSTDNLNYTLVNTITDINSNYYLDTSVVNSTTYYYKLRIIDTDNDISNFSTPVSVQSGILSDVTAPVISAVASSTTASSATVTWTTDESASSQVEFGKTSSYTSATILDATLNTSHLVLINGLDANTTYHFRVLSKDAANNLATSTDYTFFTSTAPDTQAPTVPASLTATSTSPTQINLSWVPSNDNVGVTGYNIFRDNSLVASTTLATYSDTGLTASTTYSYTLTAYDAAGNVSATSSAATTTTLTAADITAPIISAITSSTSATTATITWTTSEPATSQVNYGLTASYSAASILDSALVTSHSVSLSNLTANTVYHFRVDTKDAAGNLATSTDLTFKTTVAPDTQAPTAPSGLSATSSSPTQINLAWIPANDNIGVAGYNIFRNNSLIASTSLASFADTGLTASTTYTYALTAYDAAGNISATSSSATTATLAAADVIAPVISAVASSTSASTATITWTTNEPATSQVEYGLTSSYAQASILDTNLNTSHSVSLTNLTASTTYHFRVLTKDAAGNTATSSDYAFLTSALTDGTAPSVPMSLTATSTSPAQVSLSWIPSNDNVGVKGYNIYRDNTLLASTTFATYLDTGLTASTTYAYEVSAFDQAGNESARSASTTITTLSDIVVDNSAPVISSVLASEVGPTWAKIIWTTDKSSNSKVEYSLSPDTSFASSTATSTLSTYHEITLPSLKPNTAYLYRVSSKDASNHTAIDDNAGAGFSFTTTNGPAISQVEVTAGDTTAIITWLTDKVSDSFVYYSASSSMSSLFMVGNTDMATTSTSTDPATYTHQVELSGLDAGLTYYFYVKSTDSFGNVAIDSNGGGNYSFTTTGDSAGPVITNASVLYKSYEAGIIIWTTSELATSQIQYGTASGTYDSITDLNPTLTISHALILSNLEASTPYYYQVKSKDAFNNETVSDQGSFTTTSEKETIVIGGGGGSAPPEPKDTTPPAVSDLSTDAITAFGTTIKFTTSEPAVGLVEYGTDASYGYSNSMASFTNKHTIRLNGLRMGTVYHFRVKAVDKAGNETLLEDQTFTTKFLTDDLSNIKVDDIYQYQQELENQIESVLPSLKPPFIGKVSVKDITEDAVTITWQTNTKSYSVVEYAPESAFNQKDNTKPYAWETSDTGNKVLSHTLALGNLQPNTRYHFRVKSYSLPQVVGTSEDMVFVTKAGKVDARVVDVKNNSFRIVWTTPEPSNSVVEYRNQKTGDTYQKVEESLKTFHDMTIENVPSASVFEVKISGQNEKGNTIEGKGVIKVETSEDVTPPTITSLKIDNALVPGATDRAQTVVSWKTDEPASSVIYYQQGSGPGAEQAHLANKVISDEGLTTNHTVILSSLKPGMIYGIQVESTDQSGNTNLFPVRTIVVPQQSESVTDIIFKNFADAFKFLQNGK